MTLSSVRLRSLTIEAFRGFRDPASFELDASAVIITGPNGTGKTSVFDALQWVLIGAIERLEDLRSRRNVEHVVNSYRLGERAVVSLVISIDGEEVTLLRSGDHGDSTLEVQGAQQSTLFGAAAEEWLKGALVPHEPDSLKMSLTTCGLLQQDVMRSVLEAKPADRYAHISSVLGLSDLEGFERAAQDAATDAAERRKAAEQEVAAVSRTVESASALLETMEQRASQRSSVEVAGAALNRLLEEVPSELTIETPESGNAEEAVALAQESRQISRRVAELMRVAKMLHRERERLSPQPTNEQVERLDLAANESAEDQAAAERQLRRNEELLSSAEEASQQMARLAAVAIPLLSEECPVCGQSIDPVQVEAHLAEIAGETSSLVARRHAVEAATKEVRARASRASEAQNELAAARELFRRWERLQDSERALAADLADLTSSGRIRITVDVSRAEVLDEIGTSIASALDGFAIALEQYSDAVRDSRATGEMDRARSELSSAQALLDDRRSQADRVTTRASRLKGLADASTRARVDVTAERFEAIEPLVTDIYSRLDPHPAFKLIGFKHDTYYGKGTSSPIVRDIAAGVEADPLIVFSASQANIAALSYFLAMSLGAGDRALPFVLLDDPLQSMDDVNVLGFADLCRFLRSERQLIVSTHDPRFANLLRRKLTPRHERDRTIIHEFKGWDRRGSSVDSETLAFKARDAELRLLRDSA